MPKSILKALLWIYLRPAEEPTTVLIQISHLRSLSEGSNHSRIRAQKIDVNARTNSWQHINMKQLLQLWLKQPESHFGIEIKAFDANGNDLAVTSAESGEEGLVSQCMHWYLGPCFFRRQQSIFGLLNAGQTLINLIIHT